LLYLAQSPSLERLQLDIVHVDYTNENQGICWGTWHPEPVVWSKGIGDEDKVTRLMELREKHIELLTS
jgi:hypothetical protein